jgi:hypothetical protein
MTRCDAPQCKTPAIKAVLVGTRFYCILPLAEPVVVPFPIVRLVLCDHHLDEANKNFTEATYNSLLENETAAVATSG